MFAISILDNDRKRMTIGNIHSIGLKILIVSNCIVF